MSVLMSGGAATIVRASVSLQSFPQLRASHVSSYSTTEAIEKIGYEYVKSGFSLEKTENFVIEVCKWGNYSGVFGKVLAKNDNRDIRSYFERAYDFLQSGKADCAISEVTNISGLAVSFGSKHLKFLDPEKAVVLDSIISAKLAYSLDPTGYKEFLDDCIRIRDELNAQHILRSCNSPWRVSDVEMAIYMHVK